MLRVCPCPCLWCRFAGLDIETLKSEGTPYPIISRGMLPVPVPVHVPVCAYPVCVRGVCVRVCACVL